MIFLFPTRFFFIFKKADLIHLFIAIVRKTKKAKQNSINKNRNSTNCVEIVLVVCQFYNYVLWGQLLWVLIMEIVIYWLRITRTILQSQVHLANVGRIMERKESKGYLILFVFSKRLWSRSCRSLLRPLLGTGGHYGKKRTSYSTSVIMTTIITSSSRVVISWWVSWDKLIGPSIKLILRIHFGFFNGLSHRNDLTLKHCSLMV